MLGRSEVRTKECEEPELLRCLLCARFAGDVHRKTTIAEGESRSLFDWVSRVHWDRKVKFAVLVTGYNKNAPPTNPACIVPKVAFPRSPSLRITEKSG